MFVDGDELVFGDLDRQDFDLSQLELCKDGSGAIPGQGHEHNGRFA